MAERDTPSEAKIVVSGFRHFFETADGPVQATDHVDLAIRAGEFVTLVGPSGCGKTTLLKALAGFIRPSEGDILCEGRPVRGPGRERGVVFQELAILPWRTVRRNIGHGLEIARAPRAERERTVARLIELTGLTGFEERYPHELSGGMRQRVAVARTWAADPDVILMDEPFAAVDAMTRLTLQEELVRLCAATSQDCVLHHPQRRRGRVPRRPGAGDDPPPWADQGGDRRARAGRRPRLGILQGRCRDAGHRRAGAPPRATRSAAPRRRPLPPLSRTGTRA